MSAGDDDADGRIDHAADAVSYLVARRQQYLKMEKVRISDEVRRIFENRHSREGTEDMTMTYNLMGTLVVLAEFSGSPGKDYAYFVPKGDDPKVGDVILTSTSWDTFKADWDTNVNNYQGMALEAKLARIIDVLPDGHPKATRFYMQLISVEQLRERHKMTQAIAKQAKERADAFKKLDAMMARRSRIDQYRELAKNDAEAAKLLAIIEPPQT